MFRKLLTTAASVAVRAGFPQAARAAAQDRPPASPFPQPIRDSHHNDDFAVRVRTPGSVWQDLCKYDAKVDI